MLPVLAIALAIGACSPTAFQRPLGDFKSGVQASREVYFEQLKAHKKSELKLFTVQRRLARSWRRNAPGMTREIADEIAKRQAQPVINPDSFVIRERAFGIVIFYSDTLLALASNEDTKKLVAEIRGFKDDTLKLVDTAKKLFNAGKILANFAGPFGAAVDALEQIVRIVSQALRERAIRQAIVAADPMIQDLFRTLGEEGYLTQVRTQENYERLIALLDRVIAQDNFNDIAAKEANQVRLQLGDLTEVFRKARKAVQVANNYAGKAKETLTEVKDVLKLLKQPV